MLYHSIKQILRGLWRHKSFTFINLLGLSLGIAAVVVIFLIVDHENNFDKLHSESDKIYRIVSQTEKPGKTEHEATVPYPTGQFLRAEYPGVQATQIHFAGEMEVRIGDEPAFEEEKVIFADSLFLKVLDFDQVENFWIAGNRGTALENPGQVVLTESTAKRYFGDKNPLGELINLDQKKDVEVVGIVKDPEEGSHLPFTMLVSWSTFSNDFLGGLDITSWNFTAGGYTYVRLDQGKSKAAVESALNTIVQRNATERNKKIKMFLQPVSDIHFDLKYKDSNPAYTVSRKYLKMLMLLGSFIIFIACINYINLSTSFAFTKSKEVGIRKTIGASRLQLFFHYMFETFLITVSSALVGLLLAVLLLPTVAGILGKPLSAMALLDPLFLIGFLLGIFLITLISGSYPALVMAGFNPVNSLKNKVALPGKYSVILRKGLVVFQFATSIALIICTIVIARQMEYFQSKELGFNKEAVVEVRLPVNDSVKIESFRSKLQNDPGIQSITFGLGAPISESGLGVGMRAPQLSPDIEYTARIIPSDRNYMETYELELLAGRWFLPSEEKNLGSAVVVNRSLTETLGYQDPQEAVGKKVGLGLNNMEPTIVGVTEDFHTSSLHEDIAPVAMTPFPYFYYAAGIRIHPGSPAATLAKIESSWREVYPESVYQYSFIDETLAASYEQESRDYRLFQAFSVISIFICCIGLWGLITFVVVRKTKEIGIRKVLGARVSGIVYLISKDFLKLIGLALLIASPVAWYFMREWLKDFAYRIDISWWIFLAAGLAALIIAFITISFQAVKAALANPIKNLRTE